MIVGLGIDIVDQKRIHESINKFGDKFLQKILTEQEIISCACYRFPIEHYAGKFAVKEAFMKAIGTGLRQITFGEIEVLNWESGAPHVVTHGKAAEIIKQLEVNTIHVSLSHDAGMAAAVVMLER